MTTNAATLSVLQFATDDLRVLWKDGEPWFIAKEVCLHLQLGNDSQATSRLDDHQKGTHGLLTPGGRQEVVIVNEAGLYSLIFSSRKPAARAFEKWVTTEVLPSIRRHGFYGSPPPLGREQALRSSRNDAGTRLAEEIADYERETGLTFKSRKIMNSQKLAAMLLSGEVAAPLSKGNAWVALLGLGFDLPYILWGKRTLTKHYPLRIERAQQAALPTPT